MNTLCLLGNGITSHKSVQRGIGITSQDYIIVIPTYKRHLLISSEKGTLYFFKQNKIPKENIILFVANEEEKELYKKHVPKKFYSGNIIIGEKGILNQRHFIMKSFPEGQYIISIDDDIQDVLIRTSSNPPKLRSIQKNELKYLIENSYLLLKESKSNIWGINMVSNPFFMRERISTSLGVIPAGFYGFINHRNRKNKIKNDSREDVERSILFFDKDNIIIRYLNITLKTLTRKTEGGIQALMSYQKRLQMEDLFTQELKEKYPKYCCSEKLTGIRITLTKKRSNIKINYFNILNKIDVETIRKNIQVN